MAPYPEELDVFTIPHSRMKNLVHNYCDMLSKTNFSNGRQFEFLLNNLRNTFNEFRCHELIENKFIMKKLKRKLKELSIRNAAVCNCHKDNQLKEMSELFRDAAEWRRRSRRDRISYGVKITRILEEFTDHFLPHMKEEEEVFQPLLMKYFTYEELCLIKEQVIVEHRNWNSKYCWDEKVVAERLQDSDGTTEEEDDLCDSEVSALPPELLVKVFSWLSPVDLCRASTVCKRWNEAASDTGLWRDISPVKWARGDWRWSDPGSEEDSSADEECPDVYIKDEDADLDESDSDGSDQRHQSVTRIKREWQILQSLCKHLLPRVGHGVRYLNLARSRGLTNGSLYRILKLCPNVEKIDLSHNSRISDFGFKGFEKSNGGAILKEVNLSGCPSITDKTLRRLFANSRENSKQNSDQKSTLNSDKSPKKICDHEDVCCKNARNAESKKCNEEENLTKSLENLVLDDRTKESRLESLNLSGCYRITDAGLRSLGQGHPLPRLRLLDLSGLYHLTSLGLDKLVSRCPALDHEQFSYCDNITDGPMAALANGCQNVECPSRACCRYVVIKEEYE